MTAFPRTRGLRSLAALAVAGLLLTGCGAARPGVAAQIGDDAVSLSQLDETARLWCQAVEPQLQGQVVPMSFVRSEALSRIYERSVAEQIAQEYDVSPDAAYETSVAQTTQAAASFPEETRAVLIDVTTAQAYRTAILDAAARVSLRADGVASPTVEQVTQRGNDLFKTWPDTHEVVIDPRFEVRVQDGQLTPVDTETSFGLSKTAVAGALAQPDPGYAESLPDSQRCG